MQTNINGLRYKKLYIRKKSTDDYVLYKKAYTDGVQTYSAGNPVTYYVDTDTSYTEEVDFETSCLAPKTFTPTKDGWTFVGWREDTTASSDVLSEMVMGNEPIALCAVFEQVITLSYDGNGSTSGSTDSQTGKRYYNNGNVANPSFTLRVSEFRKTDCKFTNWAMGSASGTQYAVGDSVTLSESTVFYAVWLLPLSLGGSGGSVYGTTYGIYNDNKTDYLRAFYDSYGGDYSNKASKYTWSFFNTPIDLTNYNRIRVTMSYFGGGHHNIQIATNSSAAFNGRTTINTRTLAFIQNWSSAITYDIDITNVNGIKYLGAVAEYQSFEDDDDDDVWGMFGYNITNITLYNVE